ncbi:MAG: PH domain-containing protein [Planctomycetota bacterium]|nr:PH domain-containing protein [Planctomycetota bacterium]
MNDSQPHAPRRLHRTSPFFNIWKWVSWFIVPGLMVFLFGKGEKWEIWGMGLIVFAIIAEIYKYMILRYVIASDEIIVRQGLIFRSERHIPFERIQNIDLVQNAFHRMINVAVVKIETAGGAKPEAVLSVLHVSDVTTMRNRVFADRRSPVSEADEAIAKGPDNIVIQVPTKDLIRLGLVNNRGWTLVAILAGLAWQFDLFDKFNVIDTGSATVKDWTILTMVGVGVGGALVIMVLLYLFSITWTILRLHNYTLSRVGEDLQLQCGLFTRRSATIPRHRVQFISIEESLLHRLFGTVTIRIETAAGIDEMNMDEEASLSQKWFVPILPKTQVPRILNELQADLALPEEPEWRAMNSRGKRRYFKKMLIVSLILTLVAGALIYRPWGLLSGFVFIPFFMWHGFRVTSFLAWADLKNVLCFRSGVLTKRVSLAFFETMQVVSMHHSPFDRRHKHAQLMIDTAGAGPAKHRISIPYLDHDLVLATVEKYSRRMESAEMRW